MKKRRCQHEGCITILSEHNKGLYCYRHTPGVVIKESKSVTDCTGYITNTYDPKEARIILRPGDEGYNELAFSEENVGYVDDEGNIQPIENLLK